MDISKVPTYKLVEMHDAFLINVNLIRDELLTRSVEVNIEKNTYYAKEAYAISRDVIMRAMKC